MTEAAQIRTEQVPVARCTCCGCELHTGIPREPGFCVKCILLKHDEYFDEKGKRVSKH